MNQENNNVQDDLLAAFENPDMVAPSQTPEAPAAEPTVDVQAPAAETTVDVQAPAAPSVDTAVNVTDNNQVLPESNPSVEPQNAVDNPTVAQETVNNTQPVSETPVENAPAVNPEQPSEVKGNSEEKKEPDTDDPKHFKKTIIFVVALFVVIILFIFFLPQIMRFFGSTI